MCTGRGCHKKKSCYRYYAKRSPYQLFFDAPPLEAGECKYYWATYYVRYSIETDHIYVSPMPESDDITLGVL